MKRFAVEAYPSIFLVDGGLTRMYTGLRTADQVTHAPAWESMHVCPVSIVIVEALRQHLCVQLSEFATGGYRDAEPLPFYRSPTSAFGRALSVLYT